ncbi:MAG: hypothetical protein IT379_26565 [Deltaproteobacteria bacterium]|nr:hypothetical protein [Deltaproteobacteria bacterium]
MQAKLEAHHPQLDCEVQSEQVKDESQGSVVVPPPQSLASQSQSPQLPDVGPLDDPVMHVKLDAHQPQLDADVQSPHVAFASQGSVVVPPPQSLASQSQSPHEPLDGPPDVPVMQEKLDAHHPQLDADVQSPHVAFASQGSVVLPPPHSLASQLQSPQLPDVGPLALPV